MLRATLSDHTSAGLQLQVIHNSSMMFTQSSSEC
uniref:Uncharacterized protein n=1 Tax=Arundo donax TaxID=35708 RepID=A0A0A8YHK2_ARUDO